MTDEVLRFVKSAPKRVSDEEIAEFAGANEVRRMEMLLALVERAYEQGWSDCDGQWAAHMLEVPAAKA